MTQVSSKVDLSAITDFMTALKQATGSLQQFQAEVSKRLTEQGEAVTSFMDSIRTGGAGGDKSVKEQLLDKLAVPFDFNKILLDLQIDEKLSNEAMAKVRQKIRNALAATKGNPAAIAGVFSELFPMLKLCFTAFSSPLKAWLLPRRINLGTGCCRPGNPPLSYCEDLFDVAL